MYSCSPTLKKMAEKDIYGIVLEPNTKDKLEKQN
jgi:hypothetical protein